MPVSGFLFVRLHFSGLFILEIRGVHTEPALEQSGAEIFRCFVAVIMINLLLQREILMVYLFVIIIIPHIYSVKRYLVKF